MLTIALVSQKGGAGKTTLAVHLAAEAAKAGRRALLIDLDPQGNAIRWGERRGERQPDVQAEHPMRLAAVLKSAAEEDYDLVVLDTAPNADQTALRAAKAADLVLIPCRPAQFDLEAIEATLDLCKLAKRTAVVALNAAPLRSRVVNEAREAIEGNGGVVGAIVVHHRVAFQHCLTDGNTAGEFEPGGQAAQEITNLYDDVLTRLRADTTAL